MPSAGYSLCLRFIVREQIACFIIESIKRIDRDGGRNENMIEVAEVVVTSGRSWRLRETSFPSTCIRTLSTYLLLEAN